MGRYAAAVEPGWWISRSRTSRHSTSRNHCHKAATNHPTTFQALHSRTQTWPVSSDSDNYSDEGSGPNQPPSGPSTAEPELIVDDNDDDYDYDDDYDDDDDDYDYASDESEEHEGSA